MVTPPLPEAVNVPFPAAIVKAMALLPASTSAKVAALKSTLPAVSSVTVMLVGNPIMDGGSLTAVTSTGTEIAVEESSPRSSFAFTVKAFKLPLLLAGGVHFAALLPSIVLLFLLSHAFDPIVKVPPDTPSTTKALTVPSTSASLPQPIKSLEAIVIEVSSLVVAVVVKPVKVGASLTDLMVIEAVSVAVLNAVTPPLVVVSAVLPAAPPVVSQALKVMPFATVPL